MKVLNDNKRVKSSYEIEDKIEAGMNLEGWEVKSIKNHQINLLGAYIRDIGGEMFLVGAEVPAWKHGSPKSKEEETRNRKLLLHKRQINKLIGVFKQPGMSVIPLMIYENEKGYIKILVGVGKGRKKYDKRAKLKEKDLKRRVDIDRKKYNF